MTPHFSVNELSVTSVPGGNVPGPVEELYLLRLCELVLEPLRVLWDCPVTVTSGYRSPHVNSAVGGRPGSAHTKGQAADVAPAGLDLDEGFRRLVASGIPFDQALLESVRGSRWIHVSIPPIYSAPRRQALVTQDGVAFAPYSLAAGESQA
ncbi:MAG: hypothetical protein IPO00_09650 [Betaproteobacteria bacterium]|nr:hypothetical protein [Betaproteobacteria bacterium]